MKFESHGRKYEVNQYGAVNQLDHRPFTYDQDYAAIYDKPEYKAQSDYLQAMRIGFVLGVHGKRINILTDVGYGNGAFMNEAKKHIPYVIGVDVTGVNVEGCYILPHIVKSDVVCFFDCLEHIPDIAFVKDLPCETVVISLPYCHLLTEGKEWFDTKYPHRKSDEHVHHWNEFSLALTMDSLGWKQVAVSQHEDQVRKSKHGLQNILSMAFKRKNTPM